MRPEATSAWAASSDRSQVRSPSPRWAVQFAKAWRLLRDVEQGKQEDPDNVDEVPVDPDVLDAMQVLILGGAVRHDQHASG